ncbi:dihydrolipoamide acetyltransferase component of pyruvate dehydrogenase complex [Dissulfurispira thermophila]|uniref:Dihydrolipoamide acetyltransferase component of pyruvate dehydrogenase complex n=1 Tax=Dissulfurispira thermophila TaxID=2715679 RepID=A0A7G1GZU6_9BACT|nr:dihydrolipoamide acetyltransferase family protein [Dissulfurispira thermophila]BCB95788.1 dihydrolipoamide acetyltransferase component of pyruvate dehydrogenase complex [Dissulfurispira thermophila]
MPFDFALPDLGEGITEGEIRKWLVKEGDAIEEHQSVLEIETDKAIAEVPSPKKGRVLKINKDIGDVAKVGEILMTIIEEGEVAEEKPIHEERPKSVSVVGVLPEEEEEILAAPAVRALAKELGVRLETIKGSGPGGSITKEDVIEASEKAKKAEDQYGVIERMPVKGLRRTIAKNLILSQKTTAFVTGMEEADITELWNLRDREKKSLLDKGIYLTFLPFFIKAVHHALVEHPLLNASVDEEKEEIIIKKYYNIGIAVDTPDGLMVPVIKDVDKKTILELAKEIQDLSQKARERKIKLEEMRGSTFTITNYGHFGGTFATPIINYPDVAILGTGKISDKPWIKNGQIVIRKILPLSLTFDHRVTDGVDSAKFLSKVIQYLEDPALLFIESA